MSIGEKIKEYRLKKNWTQEELGELLNVSRSTISSWEVGRNYPDIKTLIDISILFKVSVDNLLKEDNDMVKSIDFNSNQKKNLKISIVFLSITSLILLFVIVFNTVKQPTITFEKEEIIADIDSEPFLRKEIKEISVKNNIVTVTFQSSLESSYYGYFADGSGDEAYLNLYKKKVPDDNSLKYEGTTKIDLSSMPKIKKLTVFIKD